MLSVFAEVLVTPYTALPGAGGNRYEGGPLWPNFANQRDARQCRAGHPMDRPPEAPDGPVSRLPGRFAWGGGIVPHFGHQLLDHSMRLGPMLLAEPDASFVFACHARTGIRSWEDTPTFFKEIAKWHRLDNRRVHIVQEPTQIETLVVAPQAVQPGLGRPPADGYMDYLDTLVERHQVRGPRTGVVYVSRSQLPYHYAGEGYFEGVLQDAGVRIVYPEHLPLIEQLRCYCGSEVLVMAEGSALHGLHLLGRAAVGHVRVVQRRLGTFRAWLEPALRTRTESIEFVNALRGVLQPVGLPGSKQGFRAMGILEEDALLAAAPSLFLNDTLTASIRRRWNSNEFSARVEADVLQWATGLCHGRSVVYPESSAAILEQLSTCGLGSLARPVEARLARGFLASFPDRLQRAAVEDRDPGDLMTGRRIAEAVLAEACDDAGD